MLNDGTNNIPENTIVVISEFPEKTNVVLKSFKKQIKRDWFSSHFYNCLPLNIANTYGFYIVSQYDLKAIWNGGNEIDDVALDYGVEKEQLKYMSPPIYSHFGNGILTINPGFMLRTPPNVNLMTINPPNIVLPNITVMSGVVETDNLRYPFTFNLKIQTPNVEVFIKKGTPLAGFIPIPRYYVDKYELIEADKLFSSDLINIEIQASKDQGNYRKSSSTLNKLYLKGFDIYNNKFKDHQRKG